MLSKKILLKISGEFLGSPPNFSELHSIIRFIKDLISANVNLCIVVGGGNIIRGEKLAEDSKIDRPILDQMGMLGTVINGLVLKNALENEGVSVKLMNAFAISGICQEYSYEIAKKELNAQASTMIFSGGIGCPYFSTDTVAVLRAIEMQCEFLLKMSGIDGIFDSDPKINPNARFIKAASYDQVIKNNLKVMDIPAIALARENKLKICIFSLRNISNMSISAADLIEELAAYEYSDKLNKIHNSTAFHENFDCNLDESGHGDNCENNTTNLRFSIIW